MKLLFILAVLAAAAYLSAGQLFSASPGQDGSSGTLSDKLAAWLPQQKIEQAAQSLLSNVDTKLAKFQQQLETNQGKQIVTLEEKLKALQAKLDIQDQAMSELKLMLASFSEKQAVFDQEYATLAAANHVENNSLSKVGQASTHLAQTAQTSQDNAQISDNKQRMNRQAVLQDIAQRMNRRSLTAISGN